MDDIQDFHLLIHLAAHVFDIRREVLPDPVKTKLSGADLKRIDHGNTQIIRHQDHIILRQMKSVQKNIGSSGTAVSRIDLTAVNALRITPQREFFRLRFLKIQFRINVIKATDQHISPP